MGVTQVGDNKFRARYTRNGKRISLGIFPSKAAAMRALGVARGKVQEEIKFPKGVNAYIKLSRWSRLILWLKR